MQTRKNYTLTKIRERWTDEEHLQFVEGLRLFGRGWRQIEEFIGTKTAVQIRSHAQKFLLIPGVHLPARGGLSTNSPPTPTVLQGGPHHF